MKKLNIKWMLSLIAAFTFASCDTDVDHDIPAVDAPVLVSTTPESGAAKVKTGEITIEVKYDKNIFFATDNLSEIKFTGGELISADVLGASNILTVKVNVPGRETACSLSIPEGIVTGPNQMPAPAVSVQFSTVALDKTLVAATSAKAVKLYNYLLDNFETKTLSAMMANVAWNTEMSEKVYGWTGKYPAINCFDYVHLPASVAGADWINYGDITPVKDWSDKGGIVAAMWHWNVPKKAVGEASSTQIWEGEIVMPGDWSGNVQMTDDAAKAVFADAQVGQVIRVAVKDVAAGAQGSFKNSGWSEIVSGTDYFDISGDYTLVITEDVLKSLQEGGLIIGGHDYTAVAVYLENNGTALDPNKDYAFYKADTEFDATNATVEGTWENKVFTEDLKNAAAYLKLLRDADIPVLWRPFHEAAGGWFWWGKDAASFKSLWIAMFNYFKTEGLDNLIWVWTTEGNDADWYPGDQYVDIVGRDVYNKETADCVSEYTSIAENYGNKIVSLSECGTVGLISEQWASGARWSWFMPWYDGTNEDGSPVVHADEAWWKDAMSQEFVVSREDLPSME
ncbi:glycosyl hydrolase [Bacteroides uniformis]|jgi:mannan endo-1,4-beta-mannosidase|uniref:Mannan endo-1,4-beta-mannosidase n=1 Tax=Bacteroides uniformis TaxID=820 RepID=A0A174P9F4_BACUN|nr:glycosyl hydrolase [Bacteroides uniformis]CUP55025.1 mannan endo-1%2C4-beta-mannosidase [Bacteroides uniformis]